MNEVSAIIPAAGVGKRFSTEQKKQFFTIDGKPILFYTLKNLQNSFSFKEYIVGARSEDFGYVSKIFNELNINNYKLVEGGGERFETVYNCLNNASGNFILIHDAVRPFVNKEIVTECIELAFKNLAAICGVKPKDTVKKIGEGNSIESTIPRETIILAHTPQVFEREVLQRAMDFQREKNIFVTDEAMAVELIGHKVHVSKSSYDNIKLTAPEDILFFKYFIERKI